VGQQADISITAGRGKLRHLTIVFRNKVGISGGLLHHREIAFIMDRNATQFCLDFDCGICVGNTSKTGMPGSHTSPGTSSA